MKSNGFSTFYVGYDTIEDWRRSAGSFRPVYALPLEEPGPVGSYGQQTNSLVVLVSLIEPEDATVHYVRILAGRLDYVNGAPWGDDHAERKERLNQVYALVTGWLAEQGYTVRRGAVATPHDLKFLNGWADFLKYDKEKRVYYRQASAEPENLA
jgi:hypothetical protein